MLAFPVMLCSAADQAGIKYPEDVDAEYNKDEFPHWYFLCKTQLCRPMQPGEHFENAVKIAALPVEEMKKMTILDCEHLGIV